MHSCVAMQLVSIPSSSNQGGTEPGQVRQENVPRLVTFSALGLMAGVPA